MVCDIVHRTCRALVEEHLMSKYVNLPSEERLKEIIEEFKNLMGIFPSTVGRLIFEDIKFHGFSKCGFREKYLRKIFQGYRLVAKKFSALTNVARGYRCSRCDFVGNSRASAMIFYC